jgi:hypothetical protein
MKANAQKIRSFIRVVKALERSRFYSTTETVGVRAVPRKDNRRQFKSFGFDEDQFRSALLDFRKIYLEREETNFYYVCNAIENGDFPHTIKAEARSMRKEFSDVLNKHETNYDGKNRDTPKEVLDKWLNGKYFHHDHSKRTSIDRMSFIRSVHKLVFVATVLQLGRIAIKLSKTLDAHIKGTASLAHVE